MLFNYFLQIKSFLYYCIWFPNHSEDCPSIALLSKTGIDIKKAGFSRDDSGIWELLKTKNTIKWMAKKLIRFEWADVRLFSVVVWE